MSADWLPAIGDYFTIRFRRNDRSWQDVIFFCDGLVDGFVVCHAVFNGGVLARRVQLFLPDEIRFTPAADLYALVTKVQDAMPSATSPVLTTQSSYLKAAT